MKILSPRIHGVLDYMMGGAFAAAPSLLDLSLVPAVVSYGIAGTILGLSLLTRYPLGAIKAIPFTVHGDIEFATAPLLVAMPWVAGFSREPPACGLFVGAGVALFVVWLITDYRAADRG